MLLSRTTWSVDPPAANGTMKRSGFAGHACANEQDRHISVHAASTPQICLRIRHFLLGARRFSMCGRHDVQLEYSLNAFAPASLQHKEALHYFSVRGEPFDYAQESPVEP